MRKIEVVKNLISLEMTRFTKDLIRHPLQFIFGIAFLLIGFFVLQQTPVLPYAGASDQLLGGGWVYFFWLFCTGTALEISTGLCKDIQAGVLVRLVQSPTGISAILFARFFVSALVATITIVILGIFFVFTLHQSIPHLNTRFIQVFGWYVVQCYALMLLVASITISQKSVRVAYMTGALICLPLIFIPFDRLFGNSTIFLPISGPISALNAKMPLANELTFLSITSFIFLLISYLVFIKILVRGKRNGKLLLMQ